MVYSEHKSRFEKIIDFAEIDWYSGDLWGTAMGFFFDIAGVLNMTAEIVVESDGYHDHALEALARWGYYPSPFALVPSIETVANFSEKELSADYNHSTVQLASAVHSQNRKRQIMFSPKY